MCFAGTKSFIFHCPLSHCDTLKYPKAVTFICSAQKKSLELEGFLALNRNPTPLRTKSEASKLYQSAQNPQKLFGCITPLGYPQGLNLLLCSEPEKVSSGRVLPIIWLRKLVLRQLSQCRSNRTLQVVPNVRKGTQSPVRVSGSYIPCRGLPAEEMFSSNAIQKSMALK